MADQDEVSERLAPLLELLRARGIDAWIVSGEASWRELRMATLRAALLENLERSHALAKRVRLYQWRHPPAA